MEKKTLGSFLSALRRAQGLTQQEVADRLAVSNKAVSRWERDETMPETEKVVLIADLFGVSTDYLLKDEISETPNEPVMEEKTMVVDTLEGINSELKKYADMIPQTENQELKQTLKQVVKLTQNVHTQQLT